MQGQRFSLDDGEKFHFGATLTVVNPQYWVPLNDSTGNGVGGDVCPPTPPQNLQATAGNGDVDLNWNAPSNDGCSPITEYKIYRKPGNLTTVEVSPSTATVNVKATKQFNATAKDQYGWLIPDVVITWTSSNETVGTITDAGVFTALAVGTTTVKAENGTVNGTANVTVQEAIQPVLTTIKVSPSTATVNVNATEQFNATAKDQYGWLIPDVVITWNCSNETVGTTTDAGLFTALVVGTTTVKAENGTVNDTADVTVLEPVPQNLTITNLKADPSAGVNKDNPTTVSATITSSAELELVTLFAIDTQNYQSKQYALYAEDIPVDGDEYSADWDATEFKVQNETTSSGTKPVFVGKTDIWDTTTYYGVPGNLTINATSGTAFAVALFNTGDLKLSKIIEPQAKESYSVEPGNTTFAPFAMDATDRDSITDLWVLRGSLEPLYAVTLTGTAPDYSISLVKTQVPNGDYVVGLAALDEVGDRDYNETTVSTIEDYAVSISADTTGKTVEPNVKATYTLTVKNEGTKTDNYTLSIESNADVAELNIENITNLKAGETQEVSLNVADASVGTYTVNVTVKSLTETSVTDMVSTLTTVKVSPTPTPRRGGGGGGGGGGVSDSDGDGYSDIEEIIVGTDPYDPCDPNPSCLACIGEAIIAGVITTPKPTPPHSFQDLIEKEIEKLTPGRIVFNPSEKMKVGVKERVEVRLTKNITVNLTERLIGSGEPQIEEIEVGTFMMAKLTGDNFYITPLSSEEQVVRPEGFTEWSWDVTPLKSGRQYLHITVTVRFLIPGQNEQKIDWHVKDKWISVEVNHGYTTKQFIVRHWKWIIVSIILPIVIAVIGILNKETLKRVISRIFRK